MNLNLRLVRHYVKIRNKLRGIAHRNPVLALGLALPFAVVCSNSLKNAVIMSLCMLITLVPTMVIASLAGKRIPSGLNFVIYPFLASFLLIPATLLSASISDNMGDSLGFYLQILCVNSLLIYSIRPCSCMKPGQAFQYSFMNCIGFALVMVCIAFVRELFGNGTLWNIPVSLTSYRLYGLLFPFAGFIMVGFLIALMRTVNRKIYQLLLHIEKNSVEDRRMLETARSIQ